MKRLLKEICAIVLTCACILPTYSINGVRRELGDMGAVPEMQADESKLFNPIIKLNNFDSHADLSLMSMRAAFGKVELNKDENYIDEGAGSAKLIITHNPYVGGTGDPYLQQDMLFSITGEDYRDFSNVMALSLKVYNDQEEPSKIGFRLTYQSSNDQIEWFELQPKSWTTIDYRIARETIPVYMDNRLGTESRRVRNVLLVFPRPENEERVLYIDSFYMYRTTAPVSEVDFSMQEGEVASFDKFWQMKYCTATGRSSELTAKLSWVQMPSDLERKGLLKCQIPGGNGEIGKISMSTALLEKADLKQYQGKETQYNFCFDVYVATDVDMNTYKFYLNGYSGAMPLFGYPLFKTATGDGVELKSGWNTIKIPFDKIVNNRVTLSDPIYTIYSRPQFTLEYEARKADITLYLDNFRMEKIDG